MPVCVLKSSSVGCLFLSLGSTSIYDTQLEKLTIFSESDMSVPDLPSGSADGLGVPLLEPAAAGVLLVSFLVLVLHAASSPAAPIPTPAVRKPRREAPPLIWRRNISG